jgi:hypothetical protein
MDYIILQDPNSDNLAYEVREKIKEGYVPQGGVSIAMVPGGGKLFVQAMVKTGE